jgi:hypothetical protein
VIAPERWRAVRDTRARVLVLAIAATAACTPRPLPTRLPPQVIPVDTSAAGAHGAGAHGAGTTTPALAAPLDATASPFYTTNRIDWPGPNAYRDATGAPGPDYWQQRVDYSIVATLDTATRGIVGTVTVHYTNTSPDTLRFVWMQLDQNLFRLGSKGAALYPPDTRNSSGGFAGGYTLSEVTVDGAAVAPKVDDTMMRLDLAEPVAPRGGKITIVIRYAFAIPDKGADRMGRDGTLYEMAQWYPRMAVYDDVRGWNTDPYLGQGEFYLEYGDIDYAVTVPAGFTVAGSGVLQNPGDVLSDQIRQRLGKAITSSAVIPIRTAAEAAAAMHTPAPGTKTWRFRAKDVRDVAWAAAPDFRWDATSARGVLCQAFYQWPKAGAEWEQAAENTQWTIRTYSELLTPFPYPQATSVAGTVSGMEYPMFVMDGYGDLDSPGDVFRVNDHEHGHEWFPMIVGSNERRYGWMDEGINTYINAFSQERRYGAELKAWPSGMDNWVSFLGSWVQTVTAGIDAPIMTAPDHVAIDALANVAYEKPAAVLLALRDHVIGREAMDRAMREYVHRWSYKHPTPADFFRTVENVSGQDLSWFWRGYFYSTDVLDIGIDSVVTHSPAVRDTTSGTTVSIYLRRHTSLIFPVELRLKLADGSTPDVRFPVDIWARGAAIEVQVPVTSKVVGARLWPDRTAIPDLRPDNDVWGDAPPAVPLGAATTGGLASSIAPR